MRVFVLTMIGLVATALYIATTIAANAADLEALRVGDMKKLNIHSDPRPASGAAVTRPDGSEVTLADWQGKWVLLNFWATWCAPCREEMPSLDALQAEMGSETFQVVTIATGRNSVAGIEKFFADEGVTRLHILLDPRQAMARDMAVLGLPVTLVLNPNGQEVARLLGDAHWDSPEAKALLAAMIEAGPAG